MNSESPEAKKEPSLEIDEFLEEPISILKTKKVPSRKHIQKRLEKLVHTENSPAKIDPSPVKLHDIFDYELETGNNTQDNSKMSKTVDFDFRYNINVQQVDSDTHTLKAVDSSHQLISN